MKKKLFIFALIAVMVMAFTACGGETSSKQVAKDFEGIYEDMGDGIMYISTPDGTSENRNIPVLYVGKDTSLIQIGLKAWGMSGSNLSHIYIDGMENTTEQLADTQTSLNLTGDALTEGAHIVEVVQFANDDPSSDVIVYKAAMYEVKIK